MKRITIAVACLLVAGALSAQTPQIPTLQVCNNASSNGLATVFLSKRVQPGATGNFDVRLNVTCNNVNSDGYPSGPITMHFSLSDSSITLMNASTIEQMTSTGKHTPTIYLNGRCTASNATTANIPCHYWLMLSDNKAATAKGTADVVSVLIVDKTGKRLTYGTGPVSSGDIVVAPTSN